MRIVGVSRVMDEADIIEPFIRHHAQLLHLHILLDNGSTDGTVDILEKLKGEGLPLQLYQAISPIFLEQAYNTGLYELALAAGADWVLFLDADELLAIRGGGSPPEVLAAVPSSIPALRLHVFRYRCPEPAAGTHPFAGLRHRTRQHEMSKVAIRRFAPGRVGIYGGNHFAFIDGRQELGFDQERLWLAHVPDRDPWQVARKSILARLKPLATGEAQAAHFSTHRNASFDALKVAPRDWLAHALDWPGDIVDDPFPFEAGPLRYTEPPDELARFVSLVTTQAERLARSHGAILDRKRLIRAELQRQGSQIRRLF